MENKFIPKLAVTEEKKANPRIYNLRQCPSCGESIFGMPGGRDAHCPNCGFKDPCCSD